MARKKRSGGGKLSRRAALALVGGGGLLAATGTGAFNTVEGDRGFEVSTTNDPEEALLGIVGERFVQVVSDYSNFEELLTLKNNQSKELKVEKIEEVDSNKLNIEDLSSISVAADGGSQPINAKVKTAGKKTIELEIEATSTTESESGITIETTKEIEVVGYKPGECNPSTEDTDDTSTIDRQIKNERILNNVTTSGTIDIWADNNGPITFIDGSVTANADGRNLIKATAKRSIIYITGDVNIQSGNLTVHGRDITIGGDLTGEGTFTRKPVGGGEIKICGDIKLEKKPPNKGKNKGNKGNKGKK